MCDTGQESTYHTWKCKWCKNNFCCKHVALAGASSVPLADEDATATCGWETARAPTRSWSVLGLEIEPVWPHSQSNASVSLLAPKCDHSYTCLLFYKLPLSRTGGQGQICLRRGQVSPETLLSRRGPGGPSATSLRAGEEDKERVVRRLPASNYCAGRMRSPSRAAITQTGTGRLRQMRHESAKLQLSIQVTKRLCHNTPNSHEHIWDPNLRW